MNDSDRRAEEQLMQQRVGIVRRIDHRAFEDRQAIDHREQADVPAREAAVRVPGVRTFVDGSAKFIAAEK